MVADMDMSGPFSTLPWTQILFDNISLVMYFLYKNNNNKLTSVKDW